MAQELARRTADMEILNPVTGEIVSLDAPTGRLAEVEADLKDLGQQLSHTRRLLAIEVHRRFDRERVWTAHEGGFKIAGKSDADEWEFDPERLVAVLDRLVETEVITRDAADAACESYVAYKVKLQGLNALRKNPRLRGLIEACGRVVPLEERSRRLSVTRERP